MFFCLFLSLFLSSPVEDWMPAVLLLAGASAPEELDEGEWERFSDLRARPLSLNEAAPQQFIDAGLLDEYQAAVLEDYRRRCGDILSFEELALLDGFSRELAGALRFFLTLGSNAPPGRPAPAARTARHELTARTEVSLSRRDTPDKPMLAALTPSPGLKYRMDWDGRLQAGVGSSVSLPLSPQAAGLTPGKVNWDLSALHPYLCWNGRKWPGKVLVGDYHLRFLQGLCLWSGFSMSGLSTPSAFVRRPTGISPYAAFSRTPALRGAAASFRYGGWEATVAGNISSLLLTGAFSADKDFVAAEISWGGRHGRLGLTAMTAGKTSLGGRGSWRGTDLFGELCWDIRGKSWAATAGCAFSFASRFKGCVSLRYYAPDFSSGNCGAVRAGTKCANEAGVAIGVQGSGWTLTADACLHPRSRDASCRHTAQLKAVATGHWALGKGWALDVRASVRLRNYGEKQKYDLRGQASWQPPSVSWAMLSAGASCCRCDAWGVLLWLEQSVQLSSVSLYLQEGWHRAPQWADRLYLWRRSAPGSFSVPARYGEGWFLSFYLSWKPLRTLKLYLRAGWQDFTYQSVRHRSADAALQLSWAF